MYGIEVVVTTADITTSEGCKEIVKIAMKLGPVGGIFNLAGVVNDSLFGKMDETSFADVVKTKAHSTVHFDDISRRICPELDHFVVFSSISCGYGNAGQANYGFANSVTERVVEQRRLDGFPGQAIQWGPVDDVGMLKKATEGKELTSFFGMIPQKITSCFDSLNNILSSDETVVSSVVVADKKMSIGGDQQNFEAMLIAVGFPDIKTMDRNKPILELGMDSIGGAELQQTLEREFGITTTIQELRTKTLNQIEALIKGAKSNYKTVTITTYMDEMWKNLHGGVTDEKLLIEKLKFVEKKPKILLIPGMIAGMGSIWEELDCSIYICHHINYHYLQSFDELFNAIIDDVLELYTDDDEEFVLVGYSFGSAIALKICGVLESMGKRGKLILVDGSPNAMRMNVWETLNGAPTDDDLKNYIFEEFARSKYGAMEMDIIRNVFSHTTWERRIDEYVKHIADEQVQLFVRKNFESLFNRLRMIVSEHFDFIISKNIDVTLIKPSNILSKISHDYGLREYCTGEIRIESVPEDYSTVLESPFILDVMNSLLA